jgi:transcriptional regulator with XRE-family HTH domain
MARRTALKKSIHSDELLLVCKLLKRERREAGLSQQEVAGRLGKPQSFIAKYERGERRLDVVEFCTITRVLGLDPVRALRSLIKDGL